MELRVGGKESFPSDSRKFGVNGQLLTSGSLLVSAWLPSEETFETGEAIVRLSASERWLSPPRRNLSLVLLLREDKFRVKPSLKELDLGLNLP